LSTWFTRRFVTLLGLEQSGFASWNLLFSQMGPGWAGSGSEPWGPQPTPWPTAVPGRAWREGGALHRPYVMRHQRLASCVLRHASCACVLTGWPSAVVPLPLPPAACRLPPAGAGTVLLLPLATGTAALPPVAGRQLLNWTCRCRCRCPQPAARAHAI
jgi:hypothetical protein